MVNLFFQEVVDFSDLGETAPAFEGVATAAGILEGFLEYLEEG